MSAGNIKTVSAYVAGQQTLDMMKQNQNKLVFGPQVRGLDAGNMAPACPDFSSDESYRQYVDGLAGGAIITFGFGPPKNPAAAPDLQKEADAGRAAAQRSVSG